FTKPSRRLTLPLVHLFCSLVFGLPQSGVISLGRFTWITASRRKVRALRTAPVFSRSSLALSVSLAACFARSRRTKDRALRNAEKLKAERLTYEGSDRCQAY